MSQTRGKSLEETIVSTVVGLIVSTILNWTILPLVLGVKVSAAANITLTIIYTAASILRGYCIRRHYNRKVLK